VKKLNEESQQQQYQQQHGEGGGGGVGAGVGVPGAVGGTGAPAPGDDAICQICHKTKFADGVGNQCHYCGLRSCSRCGAKAALRSDKVRAPAARPPGRAQGGGRSHRISDPAPLV